MRMILLGGSRHKEIWEISDYDRERGYVQIAKNKTFDFTFKRPDMLVTTHHTMEYEIYKIHPYMDVAVMQGYVPSLEDAILIAPYVRSYQERYDQETRLMRAEGILPPELKENKK